MAPPSDCGPIRPAATPSQKKSYSSHVRQQNIRRQVPMELPYDSPAPATPRSSISQNVPNDSEQFLNEALELSRNSTGGIPTKSPSKASRSKSGTIPKSPALVGPDNNNVLLSPSKIPRSSSGGLMRSPMAAKLARSGSGNLPRSPSPIATPRRASHALDARIQLFEGVKEALPNLDASFSSITNTEDLGTLASPPPTPIRHKRTSSVIEDKIRMFDKHETQTTSRHPPAKDLFTSPIKGGKAFRRASTGRSTISPQESSTKLPSTPVGSKRNLLEDVKPTSARSILMSPPKSSNKNGSKRNILEDVKPSGVSRIPPKLTNKPSSKRNVVEDNKGKRFFMSPKDSNNRNPHHAGHLIEEVNQLRQNKRGTVKAMASQFKEISERVKQTKNPQWYRPLDGSPTEKLQRKKQILKRGLEWNKRNNAWKNQCAMPLTPEFVSGFKAPVYKKNDNQVSLIQKAMSQTVVLKDFGNKELVRPTEPSKDPEEVGKALSSLDITATAAKKLIDAMEEIEVGHGEVIAQQGDVGEHFYIVSEGEVEIQVNDLVVGTAGMGDSFFDLSLVFGSAHSATVVAAAKDGHSSTKLFRVDQQTFRGIMETTSANSAEKPKDDAIIEGDYEDATETQVDDDDPVAQEPAKSESGLSMDRDAESAIMQRREAIRCSIESSVGLDDLVKISVLGEGQFGEVWLVEATVLEDEKLRFALKSQHKEDDIRCENAEFAIRQEIDILWELQHPFICDLVHTYEDDSNIYMLLGLVTGGELWDIIHREDADGNWTSGLASEEHARFYSLAIADTLAYIHSKRYVYRDLKPENVMIDGDGYPILVDFGFAKQLKTESARTFTFCGTPNYVAPEIIKNVGHNAGADHWALGVLIYEMLSGDHPFFYDGMGNTELFHAICEEDYYEMEGDDGKTSHEAMDIFDKLLIKDTSKRLGASTGTDILNHKWFDGLDIEKMRSKQLVAPWIPGGKDNAEAEAMAKIQESTPVASEDAPVVASEDTPVVASEDTPVVASEDGPVATEDGPDVATEDGPVDAEITLPVDGRGTSNVDEKPLNTRWGYGEGTGEVEDADKPWGSKTSSTQEGSPVTIADRDVDDNITVPASAESGSEPLNAQWGYGEGGEGGESEDPDQPWGSTTQSEQRTSKPVDGKWVFGEGGPQQMEPVDSEWSGSTTQANLIPASSNNSTDGDKAGVNPLRPEGFYYSKSKANSRTWKVRKEILASPSQEEEEEETEKVLNCQEDPEGQSGEVDVTQLEGAVVEKQEEFEGARHSVSVNNCSNEAPEKVMESTPDLEAEETVCESSTSASFDELRPEGRISPQTSPLRRSSAIKSLSALPSESSTSASFDELRPEGRISPQTLPSRRSSAIKSLSALPSELIREHDDEVESSCSPPGTESPPDTEQPSIKRKPKVRQPRHYHLGSKKFKDTQNSRQRRATVNGAIGAVIDADLNDFSKEFEF